MLLILIKLVCVSPMAPYIELWMLAEPLGKGVPGLSGHRELLAPEGTSAILFRVGVYIVFLWGWGHYIAWFLCLLWLLGLYRLLNSSSRGGEGFHPPSRFLFCWLVSCLDPRQWVLGVLNVSIFIGDTSDAEVVGLPLGCRATYAIVLRFSTVLRQHSVGTHDRRKILVRLPYDCRKTNARNDWQQPQPENLRTPIKSWVNRVGVSRLPCGRLAKSRNCQKLQK